MSDGYKEWVIKYKFDIIDSLTIIGLSLFPFFASFPYRVNIFLSWEGAYRLYLGQIPYKDFGLPMGYGYWIIPALFFKIFGPSLITLVKAQVFINIIAGFSFRSILRTLDVRAGITFLSVLLFCISYSLFNFWPWYNHTVIVFEIIALSLLLKFIFKASRLRYLYLLSACFFLFLSFFTKQDAGGLAFLVCGAIIAYYSFANNAYKDLLLFFFFYFLIATCFVAASAGDGIFYWFNYGQAPHYSRISFPDLFVEFISGSFWEKFYIGVILIIAYDRRSALGFTHSHQKTTVFFIMTLGILFEALIFKVTSYTPPDNNIFFHSFAIAFILSQARLNFQFEKFSVCLAMALVLLLWWSGVYYKYFERIIRRALPASDIGDQGRISKSTYVVHKDTANIGMENWQFSKVKGFERVYMPKPTVDGIERLLKLPQIASSKEPRVLNMTELTPLALAVPYHLDKGPLWYHKGVGIFDKEIHVLKGRIESREYDVVLFETIPYLNNFFPEELRVALQRHYVLTDRFLAPRRPTDSYIEVYVR